MKVRIYILLQKVISELVAELTKGCECSEVFIPQIVELLAIGYCFFPPSIGRFKFACARFGSRVPLRASVLRLLCCREGAVELRCCCCAELQGWDAAVVTVQGVRSLGVLRL